MDNFGLFCFVIAVTFGRYYLCISNFGKYGVLTAKDMTLVRLLLHLPRHKDELDLFTCFFTLYSEFITPFVHI